MSLALKFASSDSHYCLSTYQDITTEEMNVMVSLPAATRVELMRFPVFQ
jgi:hypothetical protein